MATTHATPSRDPANDDSLLGMARQILDKFLQSVDDMLPAQVISYDRDVNRATVRPLVRVLTTDGRQVGRAQIASVPVFMFGGGDCVLSFQLNPGDLGWIKANDRDISLFLQAHREAAPNTLRKHTFQDAMFFPDVMHGVTIPEEDADNAVFQRKAGLVRLSLWPEFLKATAPRGLVVADEDGEGSEQAILHAKSILKGSIPWPRMTQAQRDAIPVTAADEGLVVWNLDTHGTSTWNGSIWS